MRLEIRKLLLVAGALAAFAIVAGSLVLYLTLEYGAPEADGTEDRFMSSATETLDTAPPAQTVKLVFVHHSCGDNWLRDDNGGLGAALAESNYFVSDTHYKWDAHDNPDIGSRTDIGHWYTWFADTSAQGESTVRDNILKSLYMHSARLSEYSRTLQDPGGENEIVLFKSCFPNSKFQPDTDSAPSDLFGQNCYTPAFTPKNAKQVYRELLPYLKSHQEKMFVAITAPPMGRTLRYGGRHAARTRSFNNWLVKDWLAEADWQDRNVFVFDFFNILTGRKHHHRVVDGRIEHVCTKGRNLSAYAVGWRDFHPTSAGNRKATEEFVPLLNSWYHTWFAGRSNVSGD